MKNNVPAIINQSLLYRMKSRYYCNITETYTYGRHM